MAYWESVAGGVGWAKVQEDTQELAAKRNAVELPRAPTREKKVRARVSSSKTMESAKTASQKQKAKMDLMKNQVPKTPVSLRTISSSPFALCIIFQ